MDLIKDSDSVELKLTVPEPDHRSTVRLLGIDPLEAEIRQVLFLDTPDLALDRHGLVVRARGQGKGDDSVVKLRPVCRRRCRVVRRAPTFGVEVDASPGGFVCSGSMKGTPRTACDEVVAGERRVRKLFSKDQRELFAAYAPGGIELDELTVLGPLFVLKLRFSPAGFGRRLVGEMWLYPDGTRVLELSTMCEPSEAFEVAARHAGSSSQGVDLYSEQQTKTRTALDFFSRHIQGASAA